MPTYPLLGVEQGDRLALVDHDADDEGQPDAQVDVEHVGSNGVRDGHVAVAVASHQDRAKSVLPTAPRHRPRQYSPRPLIFHLVYFIYIFFFSFCCCLLIYLCAQTNKINNKNLIVAHHAK